MDMRLNGILVNKLVHGYTRVLYMSFQSFLLRQVAKYKMKDVPEGQREQLLGMVEGNPELFKKIGEEIERRKKGGENEMKASMEVMKKYRAELSALAQRSK
jgi:hypothetical protein